MTHRHIWQRRALAHAADSTTIRRTAQLRGNVDDLATLSGRVEDAHVDDLATLSGRVEDAHTSGEVKQSDCKEALVLVYIFIYKIFVFEFPYSSTR